MSNSGTPGEVALTEGLGPVAEARCWEEPRYEKPPRQMFEFVQFDGFRALPPGAHSLYTRAQLDAAVAAERERCNRLGRLLASCRSAMRASQQRPGLRTDWTHMMAAIDAALEA